MPPKLPCLQVTQLTQLIKDTLENNFSSLRVEGELSNVKPASSGHLYFTLKDEKSMIGCVMFKGSMKSLDFLPSDGVKVEIQGRISVYEQRGTYQVIVTAMSQSGEGDLLAKLEERKRRLASEGLFDQERKKPLPYLPGIIGIVTSPTGAALQDLLRILRRRGCRSTIRVFPTAVQGSDAAPQIASLIKMANDYHLADVLIVGRGGGSLEDLLPFSEEIVVREIAESRIPVISAVGHEIDFALSDLAADVRAATPTAAGEMVSPSWPELISRIQDEKSDLIREMHRKLENARLLLKPFGSDLLEESFRRILQPFYQRLDTVRMEICERSQSRLQDSRHKVQLILQNLEARDPKEVLKRGYTLITDSEDRVIGSVQGVKKDQKIQIQFYDGRAVARTEEVIS